MGHGAQKQCPGTLGLNRWAFQARACPMSSDPKKLIRIARETGEQAGAEALDLGLRVRDLRKAKGWTLEQAAVQAGLARSTLSKIENGQMSPTYEALKKLATLCIAVTIEFENPPVASLEFLAQHVTVRPSPGSVAIAQNRREEKQFCQTIGLRVAP